MKNFSDFIQYFNETLAEDIPAVAAQVLTHKEDWCGMVGSYLAELSDKEFHQSTRAHTEPKGFTLYEQPEKFKVVLIHFDLPTFKAQWDAGILGPHYHHFPFSTRLLQGSYYNWIFDNQGSLQQPQLKLTLQAKCQTGDVYTLPYDYFHCVMLPQHNTMSLMVRGKAVFDPKYAPSALYDKSEISKIRSRLLKLLSTAQDPQPGKLVSFQEV